MENAFKMEFFNSAKFFNNAKNQLEFTKETRFARYQSKFSLIFGIKKKFCFVEKIFHFLSVVHTTNTHYRCWQRPAKAMKSKWKLEGFSLSTILLTFQNLKWLSTSEDSGRISLLSLGCRAHELTLVRSSVLSGFGVINWWAFYCFLPISVWNFYLI